MLHHYLRGLVQKIYREHFKNKYFEFIKDNVDSNIDFDTYIQDKFPSIHDSEEARIRLGSDILYFIESRCDLYDITESKIEGLSHRRIMPSIELTELVDRIVLMESAELPMVIKPVKWEIKSNGSTVKYGGTLTNSTHRLRPLFTISHENIASQKIICNKHIIDTVNNLSEVPFTINKEVLEILTSKVYIKDNTQLVKLSVHPLTHEIGLAIKTNDYKKVNDITSYNSKHIQDKTVITIAKLFSSTEKFYITIYLD